MNPWIKTFVRRGASALLGVGLLGSVAAFAAAGGDCGPHHRGPMSDADAAKMGARMVERVGHRLDLDAAQKERLNKLAEVLRAQRKAAVGDQLPGQQLQALVSGNRFDRAGAQALADARAEAMRKGSPEVIAAAADFYDSLKPEQQAKVREFLQRGPGRHGGWGGGGRGPRG